MQKWHTTSSKTLVDDKWLKLRVDSCITPAGGKVDAYYVLEPIDWANCVVIDSELIESVENPEPGVIYQAMHIVSLYAALSFIKKSSLASLQDIRQILAHANN
jgi:hypothetical protein